MTTRPHWEQPFLYYLLKHGGKVEISCHKAGVSKTTVYDRRRDDAVFAGHWRAVLALARKRSAVDARRDALRSVDRSLVEELDSILAS